MNRYGKQQLSVDRQGRLLRGGRALPLRPKARLLLQALHEQTGDIVPREELLRAVWGHEHVEPQALFQLVSEIRTAAGDRNCIGTFPNRGYQWQGALDPERQRHRWQRIVAAAAGVALLAIGWAGMRMEQQEPIAPSALASPALSALDRGLAARAGGDLDGAADLLELALREYPHFGLARLELARTRVLQGEPELARTLAHDALSDARIAGDGYLEVTAQLLLSEISWMLGDRVGASALTREAGRRAREAGFLCLQQVTDAIDRRIALALLEPADEYPYPTQSAFTLSDCQREHGPANEPEPDLSELFEGSVRPLNRHA